MTIVGFVIVIVALVLGLAWYDGGRQEPRLIVQPVDAPGTQP